MGLGVLMYLKRESHVLLFEIEHGIHDPDNPDLEDLEKTGFVTKDKDNFSISTQGRLEWRAARTEDPILELMIDDASAFV